MSLFEQSQSRVLTPVFGSFLLTSKQPSVIFWKPKKTTKLRVVALLHWTHSGWWYLLTALWKVCYKKIINGCSFCKKNLKKTRWMETVLLTPIIGVEMHIPWAKIDANSTLFSLSYFSFQAAAQWQHISLPNIYSTCLAVSHFATNTLKNTIKHFFKIVYSM